MLMVFIMVIFTTTYLYLLFFMWDAVITVYTNLILYVLNLLSAFGFRVSLEWVDAAYSAGPPVLWFIAGMLVLSTIGVIINALREE